jgi:hypothetical protein
MYREARVCFVRPARVDDVTFEGEMELAVELEHGWLTVELGGRRASRTVSLPAECVGWILWKGPEKYGPTVSRGGI